MVCLQTQPVESSSQQQDTATHLYSPSPFAPVVYTLRKKKENRLRRLLFFLRLTPYFSPFITRVYPLPSDRTRSYSGPLALNSNSSFFCGINWWSDDLFYFFFEYLWIKYKPRLELNPIKSKKLWSNSTKRGKSWAFQDFPLLLKKKYVGLRKLDYIYLARYTLSLYTSLVREFFKPLGQHIVLAVWKWALNNIVLHYRFTAPISQLCKKRLQ